MGNTTRSATVVFRFIIYFGEVFRKASYAIRVRCPNRSPHTAVVAATVQFGFIGQWLVPFGISSPLAGHGGLRTNRPTVQGSQPPQYGRDGARPSRFSPVAGSVCNLPSQRALHSAGRTHLSPQNVEIIPPSPAPCQLSASAHTDYKSPRVAASSRRSEDSHPPSRPEQRAGNGFRAWQTARREADGTRSGACYGPSDHPLHLKESGTRARRTCGEVRRVQGRSPWRPASGG